ncbi:MAG: MaoC family dehydratase N-terminal domain-containing protein [Acidimicrobiia bacterium]
MSEWDAWIGREERARDTVAVAPAERLAATLNLTGIPLRIGDPLPPLWHWLYCLPAPQRSDLGEDGHARRGLFLPPIPLRRRMYAGGRITFAAPLRVGEEVERRAKVAAVVEKEGGSGPLVIVTVNHTLTGPVGLIAEEQQDLVYTDAAPDPPPAENAPVPAAAWEKTVPTDPVLLFRFSALTFNGHRIHYDTDYVRDVEGYSDLVVHGPLVALLLAGVAHHHASRLSRFEFRARAPFIASDDLMLRGNPTDTGSDLAAYTPAGVLGMTARAHSTA